MTDTEILHRAIEKAVENGWDVTLYDFALKKFEGGWKLYDWAWLKEIIFSHSFAKAFWKSKDVRGITEYPLYTNGYLITPRCLTCGKEFKRSDIPEIRFGHKNCPMAEDNGWKYHLQQMVLEENPIKYLERSI